MSEELDCQTCGACCFARNPAHVPVLGADHARLRPEEAEGLTTFRGNRCFMRVTAGRCVNLREEAGRFACTLYPRRPQVCRDFTQGSPECAYERSRAGLA